MAVVTSDGGAHWEVVKLEENPVSLFFLNDSLGWMVTEKGLWQTTEAGKDWQKLPKPPAIPLARLLHRREQRLGGLRQEEGDGDPRWRAQMGSPSEAAADPPGAPDRSAYSWIAFANRNYGIDHRLQPAADALGIQRLPAWLDPEDALSRRETPHLSYTMVTRDGGKTWRVGSASLFGKITRVRFRPTGPGLGPDRVRRFLPLPERGLQAGSGPRARTRPCFRDKRFAITDVWLTPDGTSYLAGIEMAGQVRSVVAGQGQGLQEQRYEVPGHEMAVDYRAVAQRAVICRRRRAESVAGHGQRHDSQTASKTTCATLVLSTAMHRRNACN